MGETQGRDNLERGRPSHTADPRHVESLVNAIGGVIWEFDWSLNAFTFVSDAAEELLGFSKAQWLEPGFWVERLHPEDAEWAPQFCFDATKDLRDHEFEYRMVRSDGVIVWVREYVTVDREKGVEGCLRGLMIDITARKFAEERLASSERRFREMVENVGLLAVQLDAAGTVIFANEPVERLLGKRVVGRSFLDLLPAEGRAVAAAAFEHGIDSSEAAGGHTQTEVLGVDGRMHTLRWNSATMHGPHGEFAGTVSIGEDVTEHVAYEQEISRKAEEFDAIFHLSRDLYFRVSPDGRVVGYCAPSGQPLYAPPEAFLNRKYADVLPPNAAAVLENGAARCHKDGVLVVMEYTLAVGGEEREWEARFLPLQDGDTAIIVRDVTDRNRRALELHESEERYRTLVELSPYAIYVVDLDDVVLYCNEAAVRLLGAQNLDDLLGRCITGVLPSDYVPEARADEERVAEATRHLEPGDLTPVSPAMQGSTLTLDGREVDIERTIAGIIYRGQPALLILARDITEELEVHRSVSESRDFLAKLLEMLDSGVIVVDGGPRVITRANRPAEQILGYDHDELLGASTRVIHPTEEAFIEFNDRMTRSLSPGELHNSEMTLVRKDGTAFDAEVSVRSMTPGPSGRRIGTIRDVSDRKAAERMLRESEQRFRAIIEQSPFGMHFYRLEGDLLVFTGANPAADRILGIDHSELVDRTIEEAFPPLVGTAIPDAYKEVARDGEVWHNEEVLYHEGNISGAFDVSAFQIQPGLVAAAFRDVTERRILQERESRYLQRLSALAAELADAEDAERRRLAEDLHDRVSQALAVALMHLRAAGDGDGGANNSQELGRGLGLLENAIRETRTITTELYPPVLHELGLGAALRWLCDETERLHDLRCSSVIDEPAGKKLTPEARTVLFRGARELLVNVVKHASATQATVILEGTTDGAVLIVEDDGIGFDVERVTVGGSSGFGLFSIKERLPHMGGDVHIESSPGSGTRATLRMPWADE